jgi:hypothetical protein
MQNFRSLAHSSVKNVKKNEKDCNAFHSNQAMNIIKNIIIILFVYFLSFFAYLTVLSSTAQISVRNSKFMFISFKFGPQWPSFNLENNTNNVEL